MTFVCFMLVCEIILRRGFSKKANEFAFSIPCSVYQYLSSTGNMQERLFTLPTRVLQFLLQATVIRCWV